MNFFKKTFLIIFLLTINLINCQELEVIKSVDNENPSVGDIITYKITVTNVGAATAIAPFQISDTFDSSLKLIEASTDNGTILPQPNIIDWIISNNIPATSSATLTMKVLVNSGNLNQKILNSFTTGNFSPVKAQYSLITINAPKNNLSNAIIDKYC